MEILRTGVTVVGAGVAGLWTAKELLDAGAHVTVVEKSHTLADGATTRNEGWLHAGTYHSVAIEDPNDAGTVTGRTVYGHDAIVAFAPESIDHEKSYAFTATPALAEAALRRWEENGLPYRRIDPADCSEVDSSLIAAAFEVKDKSVNSVALCQKLARYIVERGGQIFTGVEFSPTSVNTALLTRGNERTTIRSDAFVIAAGAGLQPLAETLTGQELPVRYFQAHLLVAPRLTRDNYFYLDVGEAGIMSHGNSSVIGINRDGKQLAAPSYAVDPEKRELVMDAAARLIPAVATMASFTMTVACCKPDLFKSETDTQSLNVQVFEPLPGYICALPGKMTEAPYLGKMVAEYLGASQRSLLGVADTVPAPRLAPDAISVTPRPLDIWAS